MLLLACGACDELIDLTLYRYEGHLALSPVVWLLEWDILVSVEPNDRLGLPSVMG
jgi:hypothetical protein